MGTSICPRCNGIRRRTACLDCGGTGVFYVEDPNNAQTQQVIPLAELDPYNTVEALAQELHKPVWLLIEQLEAAGCGHLSALEAVTNDHRNALLRYLKSKLGS